MAKNVREKIEFLDGEIDGIRARIGGVGNAAQRAKIGMMIAIRADYQDAVSREQSRRVQAERQEGGE